MVKSCISAMELGSQTKAALLILVSKEYPVKWERDSVVAPILLTILSMVWSSMATMLRVHMQLLTLNLFIWIILLIITVNGIVSLITLRIDNISGSLSS